MTLLPLRTVVTVVFLASSWVVYKEKYKIIPKGDIE